MSIELSVAQTPVSFEECRDELSAQGIRLTPAIEALSQPSGIEAQTFTPTSMLRAIAAAGCLLHKGSDARLALVDSVPTSFEMPSSWKNDIPARSFTALILASAGASPEVWSEVAYPDPVLPPPIVTPRDWKTWAKWKKTPTDAVIPEVPVRETPVHNFPHVGTNHPNNCVMAEHTVVNAVLAMQEGDLASTEGTIVVINGLAVLLASDRLGFTLQATTLDNLLPIPAGAFVALHPGVGTEASGVAIRDGQDLSATLVRLSTLAMHPSQRNKYRHGGRDATRKGLDTLALADIRDAVDKTLHAFQNS